MLGIKCIVNFKFNTVEGGSYFPLMEESIELPVSLNGVERFETPNPRIYSSCNAY